MSTKSVKLMLTTVILLVGMAISSSAAAQAWSTYWYADGVLWVRLNNQDAYDYACTVTASNGAHYSLYLPMNSYRIVRINDPYATFVWQCSY